MKRIPLSKGRFALVDDEDYEYLMQWNWYAQKSRNTYYAVRATWDRHSRTKGSELMHRNLCGGTKVDHIDMDGLNNQRQNLRPCNDNQNQQNRRKQESTSSTYKGVSWDRTKNKWKAQITVPGVPKHLGYFTDEREAADAYNKAAEEYFGEFARTNNV